MKKLTRYIVNKTWTIFKMVGIYIPQGNEFWLIGAGIPSDPSKSAVVDLKPIYQYSDREVSRSIALAQQTWANDDSPEERAIRQESGDTSTSAERLMDIAMSMEQRCVIIARMCNQNKKIVSSFVVFGCDKTNTATWMGLPKFAKVKWSTLAKQQLQSIGIEKWDDKNSKLVEKIQFNQIEI